MNSFQRNLIISLFLIIQSLFAQPEIIRLPSESAGAQGIALEIRLPETPRFPEGAPVVVFVVGGFDDNGLPVKQDPEYTNYGFIQIHFSWPGMDPAEPPATRSGGHYDWRGENCVNTLRDVLLFAQDDKMDKNGKRFSELTQTVTPLTDHIGIAGFSNGGNAALTAAGMYGDTLSGLAWIVNYESPVGDGMPGAECGATKDTSNPLYNPAYDTLTGQWDLTTLAWDDTVNIIGGHLANPANIIRGGIYFDINQNNIVDWGTDFVVYPIKITNLTPGDTTVFYSERLLEAADSMGILPSVKPAHFPTVQENRVFWHWRNGEKWIQDAVTHNLDLMFTVFAFKEDHVQSAPDKPHIFIQYHDFLNAGCRFARINPDRAYVEFLTGRPEPQIADNPGNHIYTHLNIRNAMNPNKIQGKSTNTDVSVASVCELADRTYYNDTSAQLNQVYTAIESQLSIQPYDLNLFPCYPNPFNQSSVISYELSERTRISLRIYDITGRAIDNLVTTYQNPGFYKITYNAAHLTSGMYIIRLNGDGICRAQKMTIVK